MDETWLIQMHGSEFVTGESIIRLPRGGSSETLLISVERGMSTPLTERDDLLREVERYR